MKLLLENGADFEAKMSHGFTPLIQAASDNNIEAVKLLLEYGADIDAQSANKGTALVLAIVENNYEIVKLLLEEGANPNLIDAFGWTALDYTDAKRNNKIINLLIEKKAIRGNEPESIPELVQAFLDYDLEKAEELLMQGHNINQEFDNTNALIQSSELGYVDLVEILLDYGADINYKTKSGFTPLIVATNASIIDVVKVLLERGADTKIKGYNGFTALDIATKTKPNKAIADILKSHGSITTVSDKNNELKNMMKQRVQLDMKELMLQKLIEFGDEVKTKEFFQNLSPQELEREIGKIKTDSIPFIEKSLRRKTLSNEEMLKDIVILSVGNYGGEFIHENLRGVKFSSLKTDIGYFLDFPYDFTVANPWTNSKLPNGIDWSNNIGQTYNNDLPFIFVTFGGHIFLHNSDELKARNLYRYENDTFLIVKKAEAFDYENTDLYEQLFALVKNKYNEKTEAQLAQLLNKNLDINKTDNDGKTALLLAIENQNVKTIEFLLKNGAEVNIQDKEGFSPLMIATSLNNFEICSLLVTKGADIHIKNYRGQDCALLAAKNMNPEIIILFEDLGLEIQNPKPYRVEEFEEKNAIELATKIEDELVERELIAEFMIFVLDYNYAYELDIDDYIARNIGFLVYFRAGRETNFSKKVVDAHKQLHKYLGDINDSDESKN